MPTRQPRALDGVPVRSFAAQRWSAADRCAQLCAGTGADLVTAAIDIDDPVTSLGSAITDAPAGTIVLVDLPSMTERQLAQWHETAPRWADAGLFVVAFSPFGLTGPYAGRPGDELVVQAATGLMSTTGYPHDPPLRTGVAATTTVSAFVGLLSVLASRLGSDRGDTGDTGDIGDIVDVAQFDVGVCLLGTLLPGVFVTGRSPKRIGNRHPMSGPWNTYPTTDGWVVVTTIGDQLWHALARLIDRPDLIDIARYATADGRVEHAAELDEAIGAWTGPQTTAEVMARATASGIPNGEIRTLAEAVDAARGRGRIVGEPGAAAFPFVMRTVGPEAEHRRSRGRPRAGELPLTGLRIVEVGSLTSAPLGGRLLGMLGADVTKVEPPAGELSRHMSLPVDGSGYLFHINNTDKCSRVFDIRESADREQLQGLLQDADAFLANLAPSTLRRFGLGPDDLGRTCPGIVHCTVSGFGSDASPEYDKAFDTVIQAMTGMMDTTGFPDGPPTKAGFSLADLLGGFASAAGVLCGLLANRREHRSVTVDIAMEGLSLFASEDLWTTDANAVRMGNRNRENATSDLYRCADGWLAVGPVPPADDAFVASLAEQPVAEALAAARTAGVAASPALELAEVLDDPHLIARGVVVELATPAGDPLRVLGRPMTYLRAPVRVRAAAPRLNPARGTPVPAESTRVPVDTRP